MRERRNNQGIKKNWKSQNSKAKKLKNNKSPKKKKRESLTWQALEKPKNFLSVSSFIEYIIDYRYLKFIFEYS